MKRIFSFDNNLVAATGAHRVLVDIHNALKEQFEAKVLGTFEYSKLNPHLGIKEDEYLRFRNPFLLRNSILFVHQRRLAILFNILNKCLFLNIIVIYVHHNILKGKRGLSFFPENIITISDRCIDNLTNYFGVPRHRITKIYNAVPDSYKKPHNGSSDGKIRILYPATVYPVKRQIQVYKHLQNSLPTNIELIFAGGGQDLEELKLLTKEDSRFVCLGFVDNVKERLANVDYCMLFSEYEGLPISLIEATMMGVPIICNDVGGNLEIAKNGYNAIVCNTWDELSACLNSLSIIDKNIYLSMSENSRSQYLNNFTFESFKNNYINYIKSIE